MPGPEWGQRDAPPPRRLPQIAPSRALCTSRPALEGCMNHGQANAETMTIPADARQRPQTRRHPDRKGTHEKVQEPK